MGKYPDFKVVMNELAKWCSRSEKCAFDIRQRLRKRALGKHFIEKLIEELKAQDFINHKRYATAYTNERFNLNGWGKIKIRAHLRYREIEEEIITEALSQISPEEYEERLLEILRKKNKSLKADNEEKRKAKLFHFARGRGFEQSLVAAQYKNLTAKNNF